MGVLEIASKTRFVGLIAAVVSISEVVVKDTIHLCCGSVAFEMTVTSYFRVGSN